MYAKIINIETKQCEVGTGTNVSYYQKIGMEEMKVEQAWNGAWYVKGYAPEKPEEVIKQEKIEEYKQKLKEIDEKSTRSMRAKLAGNSTPEDDQYLANLEVQAEEYRQKIKDLGD